MQALHKDIRRSQVSDGKRGEVIEKLAGGVWGIDPPRATSESEAAAYLEHYKGVTRLAATRTPAPVRLINRPDKIVGLVQLLSIIKQHSDKPLKEIAASIATERFAWVGDGTSDCFFIEATHAVVALWLFVNVQDSNDALPLSEAIAVSLPSARTTNHGYLPFDLSAKSITRKGGFTFVWTSDLSKHLTLASRNEIHFFRHSRVLDFLARGEHANLYPPGYLEEVRRTFRLFFPTEAVKDAKRTRKIAAKYHVDLEAQVQLQDRLNLSRYQYFGERLAAIGKEYNATRPTRLRQWWYDRRNRVEWVTLLVAVTVFILTLIFGIVSSVTGVMQVYAAFRWR